MTTFVTYNGRVGRLYYFLWKISLVVFFGILIKVHAELESFGIIFLKKGSAEPNQYGIEPLTRKAKSGQYGSQNEVLRKMVMGTEKNTAERLNSSIVNLEKEDI